MDNIKRDKLLTKRSIKNIKRNIQKLILYKSKIRDNKKLKELSQLLKTEGKTKINIIFRHVSFKIIN